MKKNVLLMIVVFVTAIQLQAQQLFNDFGGTKGYYNKTAGKSKKVVVPQLAIGFNAYYEEIKGDSKRVNGRSVNMKAKSAAILNSDMKLEDYQMLADEFQVILEEELSKAGVSVYKMNDFIKTKSYEKLSKKFSNKTENKQENNEEDLVKKGKIKVFPKNSLFLFDEKTFSRGGVPFITSIRNLIKDTEAVPLLQNIDITFATLNLDSKMDGLKLKSNTSIAPNMSITRNLFDVIGNNGANGYSASLATLPYVSKKSYEAKIYQEPAKGKSIMQQLFGLGWNSPDINFDPYIVEMNKETYKENARVLFRQYAQDFAKAWMSTKKK